MGSKINRRSNFRTPKATRRRDFVRALRFEGLDERLPFADLDDSLAEAISLGTASTTPKILSDSISPDTDVDMYKIVVANGQMVDFDVDTTLNGPGGLGSFLRLFDSAGTEISWNNDGLAPGDTGLGYDAYIRYTFASGGTYYVSVSNNTNTLFNAVTGDGDKAGGSNSTGSYTLTATAIADDTDDSIPEAVNLGTITATPQTPSNTNIVTDIDVDMFKFAVNAGQSVDFDIDTSLNGTTGLESFLRVFNSSGQEIAFNDDGAGVGENVVGYDSFIRMTFTTAGTYYVGVSNVNNTLYNANTGGSDAAGGLNSVGAYTLTIQTTAVPPNDPDDAISEAIDLGTVATTQTKNDSISLASDVDMYKFTATAGQVIDFDIDTTLNGQGGLGSYLRIFNSSGTELANNNDALAPGETILGYDAYLRFTAQSAGVYYVGVSNSNNSAYNASTGAGDASVNVNGTGSYTLIAQTIAVDTDDQISEARSLGNISTTAVTMNDNISPDTDVDMYSFGVAANQIVDFDIDTTANGTGGVDSYIRIFNSSGTQIASNNSGIGLGENFANFDPYLRMTFTTGGNYYIAVSNANNTGYSATAGTGDTSGGANTVGAYSLIVATAPAVPNDTDDATNEAINLGAIGTTASSTNGGITPDTDVDMYGFTVTANQVVDFDIDTALNGPGGLGSYLRLFNSAGTQIASNNDAMAPGESAVGYDAYLRFTFTTAGTYYLGVSNAGNTTYDATTGNNDVGGSANSTGNYTLVVTGLPVDSDDQMSEVATLGTVTATPITRNDNIVTDIDVDLYKFTVSTGDIVDFDIDTTLNGTGGLGSYIRLFDSTGTQIASNNDAAAPGETTLGFDAYLRYTFASGGTYYLGVSNNNNASYNASTGLGDTAGGANSIGTYSLAIQLVGNSTNDTDDTIAEAPAIAAPSTTPITISSSITPETDVNMLKFTVVANQAVDFDIDTATNGGNGLGSYLRLFDSTGTQLAANNDAAAPGESVVGFDAYLRYTFANAGTYFIAVSNANNINYNPSSGTGDTSGGSNSTGSYQLIVTSQPLPALTITTTANSILELNGSTVATLTRVNSNNTSALLVTLASNDTTEATVPQNVTIPAGQSSVTFTITAVDDSIVDGTQNVTISATATGLTTGTFLLQVTDNDTASGALALSSTLSSISEAGGTTTGTVTRPNTNITSSLVVNLSSSDTGEATVPATVTIPANQTSVTFTITGVDDSIVDGTQSVTITATATGLTAATLNMSVTDNDSAAGALSLSSNLSTFSENGAAATGTVTRPNTNITSPLVVTLSSNDTSEATVPATVTIPANQTSVTFTITGVDDSIVDGTQNVTITATASGLTAATLPLQVTDDDTVPSVLSLSATTTTFSEFNGTTTATVSRSSGNITQPLVVTLLSNDTSEATVPATVTIPANSTSVTFTITGVDDTLVDGTQNVSITASATGFTGANLNVQVTDNDVNPALTLSAVSTSISETNGTTTATISRSGANTQPLVVNLSSSDTTEATVPATVTIPANLNSVTFTITAVNDVIIDGPQAVTITATATGLTSAQLGIVVTDNDSLWHNVAKPLDVNNDTRITAFDAIAIITYLNEHGAGPVPTTGTAPPYYDVNSDGQITAFDAIEIITYLNQNPVPPSGPEAIGSAGEAVASDLYFAQLGDQIDRDRHVSEQ